MPAHMSGSLSSRELELMDEIGTTPPTPRRKHLQSPATLTGPGGAREIPDLTRHHGQGNGLRVHGIYFAAVSAVALLLLVAGIVIATAKM